MKKVVALLLAVVLLLSLMTACSKNAGNSDVEETGDEQITIWKLETLQIQGTLRH